MTVVARSLVAACPAQRRGGTGPQASTPVSAARHMARSERQTGGQRRRVEIANRIEELQADYIEWFRDGALRRETPGEPSRGPGSSQP